MSRIALAGAEVVTAAGEPLSDATVVVDGERIAWVGPAAEAPLDGATVVDCDGLTVTPGLFDGHAHLVYDQVADPYTLELAKPIEVAAVEAALHAAKLLRMGFTSIRDVGTRGNIAVVIRDMVDAGRIPGPRIQASKQIISVWGGLGDMHPTHIFKREQYTQALTEIVSGPWQARDAVRQQVKDGADWIKCEASGTGFNPLCPAERDTMSEEELRAICDEAAEKERPVVCHAESRRSIVKAARAGVRTIEHAVFLDDEGTQAILDHDVAVCPTLGLYTAYAEKGLEFGMPRAIVENHRRTHGAHVAAIRKAYESGVTIFAGSDSGLVNFPQGGALEEVCVYVEVVGMSPHEALLTATRNAAQVMGVLDAVGTIEAGKLADLVIWPESPLARIRALTDSAPVAVLRGGTLAAGALPAPTAELAASPR